MEVLITDKQLHLQHQINDLALRELQKIFDRLEQDIADMKTFPVDEQLNAIGITLVVMQKQIKDLGDNFFSVTKQNMPMEEILQKYKASLH